MCAKVKSCVSVGEYVLLYFLKRRSDLLGDFNEPMNEDYFLILKIPYYEKHIFSGLYTCI